MGRKLKPEHRKYSERITFVSLPAERARYAQTAESCDKDLSEWIRDTLNAEVDRLAVHNAAYEAADRHLDSLLAEKKLPKKARAKQ